MFHNREGPQFMGGLQREVSNRTTYTNRKTLKNGIFSLEKLLKLLSKPIADKIHVISYSTHLSSTKESTYQQNDYLVAIQWNASDIMNSSSFGIANTV